MAKDRHFDKRDCSATGATQKIACSLFGPDWEEIRRVPTKDLDDVTERCKRCGLERPQPKW